MKPVRKNINSVASVWHVNALGKRPNVSINTVRGARIRQKRAVNTKKL